jgi:hypothetical protein
VSNFVEGVLPCKLETWYCVSATGMIVKVGSSRLRKTRYGALSSRHRFNQSGLRPSVRPQAPDGLSSAEPIADSPMATGISNGWNIPKVQNTARNPLPRPLVRGTKRLSW